MARLEINGKLIEVANGENIMTACQVQGLPCGCYRGACGICKVEILEGTENLYFINKEKELLGITRPPWLACQYKIKQGLVKIKF